MKAQSMLLARTAFRRVVLTVLALFAVAGTASAQTVNVKDYFPLTQNSFWHYTGSGQPGSSTDDDFMWQVQVATKDISATTHATQIKTITDEPTDARNGDFDYWFVNPTSRLLFYGTKLATAHGAVPAQDIVLSKGLLIGGNGQQIGDVVQDSSAATVQTGIGPLSGTINSKVTYLEIVPKVVTQYGIFTDVLHLVITLKVTVFIGTFDVKGSEFYLKQGFGMIKQDQDADPNDAEVQVLDAGQVNSVPIVPDGKNSAGLWTLYR